MSTVECVVGILCVAILSGFTLAIENDGNYTTSNETSSKFYQAGVDSGIINPEKYSFDSFMRYENVFRDLYNEYVSMNETEPINYEEWLVMNNFGILPDTQESLYERKITKRSTADNKRRFVNTVRKGDILITGRGIGGFLGHAALMTTDTWVLEMPGGKGWAKGLKDNNRQVRKDRWFDEHATCYWTTVYRVPDKGAANGAAVWADHTYYNPKGGAKNTKHITYLITPQLHVINPSYCSKVLQAYYWGVGNCRAYDNTIVFQQGL